MILYMCVCVCVCVCVCEADNARKSIANTIQGKCIRIFT